MWPTGRKKSFSYHAVITFLRKTNPLFLYCQLDHIVPPENVLAIALPSGPKNIEFEFTAANRSNTNMVNFILSILLYLNSYVDG